ncbi:MAG: rod shape-determining protein MreC [Candidatus Paceibacterota bacterium]|jgi:cell shape-determining protein MreC
MSYLLDKKLKRKKFFNIILGVLAFFVLFYFRVGLWNGFSFVTHSVFRPVLVLGNGIGGKFTNLGTYFTSKNALYAENQKLIAQLKEGEVRMANYDSIFMENEKLKEILGRKNENTQMIVSAILSKSDKNIYDSLIIDVGVNQKVKIGDTVFALGNVPIGRIAEVYSNSANVVLFSNSGEKTQGVVSLGHNPISETNKNATSSSLGGDVYMELVGRGGGNFEMVLPRDFVLQKGDQVIMPGMNSYVLAVVETIISDPRDPFTKALLRSPVNAQELKYVEVEQ